MKRRMNLMKKEAERLSKEVLNLIIENNDYENLTVERVQDYVELVLLNSEHKKTAKAYIIYRERRQKPGARTFLNSA